MEDNKASQEAEHGEDSGRQRHVPVLLEEAIHFLNVRRGGTYIDATLGLGGHSYELAKRLGPQGHLIGFDKDPKALELARKRLGDLTAELGGEAPTITLINESYAEVGQRVAAASADGLLADLGSSFLSLKAFIALNPPRPAALTTASLPPVIIISALPRRIVSKASITALVEEAQALTTA